MSNTTTPEKDFIADSDYSKVHNESVIDPLVNQMRDAGYAGTLTQMIGEACRLKQEAELKNRAPSY